MIGAIRATLVVLLVVHAFAHLPGFIVAWQIRSFTALPYTTTVLDGRIDVGFAGTRILGALWLAAGLGMAMSGAGVIFRAAWLPQVLWPLLGASTMLCILGWPAARLGLVGNILIGAALFAATETSVRAD